MPSPARPPSAIAHANVEAHADRLRRLARRDIVAGALAFAGPSASANAHAAVEARRSPSPAGAPPPTPMRTSRLMGVHLRRAARFRHRPCGRGAGPIAFAGPPAFAGWRVADVEAGALAFAGPSAIARADVEAHGRVADVEAGPRAFAGPPAIAHAERRGWGRSPSPGRAPPPSHTRTSRLGRSPPPAGASRTSRLGRSPSPAHADVEAGALAFAVGDSGCWPNGRNGRRAGVGRTAGTGRLAGVRAARRPLAVQNGLITHVLRYNSTLQSVSRSFDGQASHKFYYQPYKS